MPRSAFSRIIDQYKEKHEAAKSRQGWHSGFEYRITIIDGNLSAIEGKCRVCGEGHPKSQVKNIEGRWIRPKRPCEIAKNWSDHHPVTVTVERRKVSYHHKLGKKSYPLGTWINEIEALGDWQEYKKYP